MNQIPKPGVYYDIPFEDYLSWDAISNSRMNQARRSLAHFKANVGVESTKALRLGSLAHTGQLEPLELAKRYAVIPDYHLDVENTTKGGKPSKSKTTEYYQAKLDKFLTANEGKEIVDQTTYDKMIGIVTSIANDETASRYLNGPGQSEVTMVWECPQTGLLCKSRLDFLRKNEHAFVDLKTYTAEDGAKHPVDKFTNSIASWGYHRQMAHYQDGAYQLTGSRLDAVIVAVETAAPYCVMAAPISEDWLEHGYRERLEIMRKIALAKERDEWPGYTSPKQWNVPAWYDNDQAVELTIDGETIRI